MQELKKNICGLVENLDNVFNKEITFSGIYSRPTEILNEDFIFEIHHVKSYLPFSSEKLVNLFGYIHRWFPANPSKARTVERSNELYLDEIDSDHRYSNFNSRIIANAITKQHVNPKDREYRIEKILRQYKHIVVMGNKGVGKTSFFNFWLNNRTEFLETKEKKLWFRVDASKYYGLGSILEDKEKNIQLNLELYHKIHTIYVISKYGIQEDFNSDSIIYKTWRHIKFISQNDEELLSFVDIYIADAIKNSLHASDDKDTERFLEWSLRNENYRVIERIYDYCYQYWSNEKYGVIFIVDGVDNISWTRESIDHYNNLCKEIGRLFINDFRESFCDNFSNILIIIRPETYKDIEIMSQIDHLNSSEVNSSFKCVVAPANVHKIIKHKSKIIKSPKSHEILEYRNRISEEIFAEEKEFNTEQFENQLHNFINLSETYINDLSSAIIKKYDKLNNFYLNISAINNSFFEASNFDNISTLLDILFNDNIRAFIDNFIENYSMVELAKNKHIPGAMNTHRYPQYLLLNGRLFLDSPNVRVRKRGESYPNIFWWDFDWVNDNANDWYGLSVIRIIQLLNEKNELSIQYIKKSLLILFSYPDMLIEKQISRLTKYGLIKNAENRVRGKDYNIALTKKGKFIYEYMFMNSEWLYFCSLDTPLDNKFSQDKDSRYVKLHRDLENNFINVFNVAFITTIITFSRHILTQQAIDQKRITEYWKPLEDSDATYGLFYSQKHALSTFKLPFHFNYFVKDSIKHMFLGLYRRNKDKAEELYYDLVGLYPGELS